MSASSTTSAILAREVAGLDLQGYGNIYFDVNAWGSELWTVPHDADYDREIKAAGDGYWNEFVLAGILLPHAVRPVLGVDGGLPPDLRHMAEVMTRLSLLDSQIYPRKKKLKSRIEDKISKLGRFEDRELPPAAEGALKVTAKRNVDVDAIVERPMARAVDIHATCLNPGDYDADELATALCAAGGDLEGHRIKSDIEPDRVIAAIMVQKLDPEPHVKEAYRFDFNKARKTPDGETMRAGDQVMCPEQAVDRSLRDEVAVPLFEAHRQTRKATAPARPARGPRCARGTRTLSA